MHIRMKNLLFQGFCSAYYIILYITHNKVGRLFRVLLLYVCIVKGELEQEEETDFEIKLRNMAAQVVSPQLE